MIRLKRLYAHNFKQLEEIELHFPDAARILVQGRNEAGKSTLFEAIFFALFGSALATETGARGLDGLIAYETEKARVELDLACGNRLFKITRTIVRAKTNTWELAIEREGQPPEETRGNTAVNRRLIGELGFDGEALLNTCFVEQKKLEKLEGLSRAKREESLAKLLNLDALVDVENDLKIRAEDRQEVERLKRRAELADIQDALPACERDLADVDRRLRVIELARAVDGAIQETRILERLDREIRDLGVRRDALAHRAERIDGLKEAMREVKEARDTTERAAENRRELQRLEAEQVEIQAAAGEAAQLQEQAGLLRQLAGRIRRLGRVESARDASRTRVTQLEAARERLINLDAAIAGDEQRMARLEEQRRRQAATQALQDWIAATGSVVTQDEIERDVRAKVLEREQILGKFRAQISGLVALLLVFVAGAAILPQASAVLVALAILAFVVVLVRVALLWRDLSRAAQELGHAQGEASSRAAVNQVRMARVEQVEQGLAALGVDHPASADEARATVAALAMASGEEAPRTDEELGAELDAARERVMNARAVQGELQNQNSIPDAAALNHELDQCARSLAKCERILAGWELRVRAAAKSLQVDPSAEPVRRAIYQVDARSEQLKRRLVDAGRIAEEMRQRREQVQQHEARAHAAYDRALAAKPEAAPWSVSLTATEYTALGKELRSEYDTLGGEAVIKQARDLEGELGRRQGERDARAKTAQALVARTLELVANTPVAEELGISPSLQVLQELRQRFPSTDLGDEATLRAQHRECVGRLHSLKDRQMQLDRDLGLGGLGLDRVVCRAEYTEAMRQTAVRERAVEIVSSARRRIVHKVLPATMDFMRRILPTLTRDRYHDAQLDSESYKIQVWDERAGQGGAFKEKNIFSGGTKDQFSLALRLAFALATLPQERGTAPSFIFLDEPLGSFDDERAQALIYLLTEGEIARAFDQIFLISHVRVDERLFTHRLVLENGRVQSTDLPAKPV